MRKNMITHESNGYKIIVVDDEQGIVDSLSIFLKRSGYDFTGITNPVEAIERVRQEHFDMMILDFMMDPIHGDEVVEEIRKFNKELYILLLTGHKDLAPPLETIKRLDIQGYCEKSDKFDQLLLLIESGIKSIEQMKTIKEIWDYRQMIISLVKRDLRGRYKGSALGFLWTFLNPLLQLVVYTFVFSTIMRAGIEDYYLFLFVTLVPWTYFASSVSGGASCIIGQKDMVNKIYFPREVLPIAHVFSQLVNMLLTYLVVIIVLIFSGKGIYLGAWGYLPFVILQETLLAIGLAMLFSAISVYFRDMQYIISVLILAWQFMSPVMYSVEQIPDKFRTLFYLNPMTPVIEAYRDIFYYKKVPDMGDFMLGTVFGIIVLIIGIIVFGKLKKHFAEVM